MLKIWKLAVEEDRLKKITMSCGTKTQSFKICRCACKWRCQCLIARMKKPGAPFGTGSKRGTHIGLHPKFYTNDPVSSITVGSYDPLIAKSKSTGIRYISIKCY